MSITNPTVFSQVAIGAADRKDDVIRAEVWRTVNSVGRWRVALRNINGAYNNTFDIQDQFLLDVNGLANTLMQGRVDGPGVTLQASDFESVWDEYCIVSGYDQMQDLLFHNDLEAFYPNPSQQIKTVLNDVINIQITTNITYVPPVGATPVIGAIEFRKGTSFLSTLQEMFRRAGTGWLFYVDDVLTLQSGAPGFSASAVIINSVAGGATNNVIGSVEFQRRDGDKLYNKIEVFGRTPQFDAYTEYTANRWATLGGGWSISDETVTIAPVLGNQASIRMDHTAPPALANASITLDFSQMYLDEVDLSSGEIGFWWRYDGGTSGARACAGVALQDNALNVINYYSGPGTPPAVLPSNINSTRCIKGEWGWCTVPVGRDVETGVATVPDTWWVYPAGGFNWDRVTDMAIQYQTFDATAPDEFEVDGLTLPFAPTALIQDGASQLAYRTRPLIVPAPYLRHQLTIERKAAQLSMFHSSTGIDYIKFMTSGNQALRYAGQSVTVNIPSLGLNNAIFYMTSIHHIIEPRVDVSDGYGFDWVTEIEAVPVSGTSYDMSRLREEGIYSGVQLGTQSGTGLRVK